MVSILGKVHNVTCRWGSNQNDKNIQIELFGGDLSFVETCINTGSYCEIYMKHSCESIIYYIYNTMCLVKANLCQNCIFIFLPLYLLNT